MSPFQQRRPQDEEREDTRGPEVDLDTRVCLTCRREVAAWLDTCPDDGGDVVRRQDLPPVEDPLLSRFLDEQGED